MTQNRFVNREISWLDFNARVLQEAQDENVPLIERLRFIGIFSNNLDEFYKVRYATVKRIARLEEAKNKVFGDRPAEVLLKEITSKTIALQKQSLETLNTLHVALEQENIFILKEDQINEEQQRFINIYFSQEVGPSLVTLMLNNIQSISKIKDSNAFLAIRMVLDAKKHPFLDPIQFALIEIPSSLKRFVVLPSVDGKTQLMLLDDLIRTQLSTIFDVFQHNSIEAHMVKFSRDAELDFDDDLSKSYIEKVAESVKDRSHGEAVRFVYDKDISDDTLLLLIDRLDIDNRDSVISGGRYHNRRDYIKFPDLGRSDLKYQTQVPLPIVDFDLHKSLFSQIALKDRLMFTPYHSFSYLVKFLREAAIDPNVKSISITIYRLSKLSNVASALIQAVRNGKRVTVQIELQARFDEEANIGYAEEMKKEGINLIFGVPGLKVHSKICVVHRIEGDILKRYGFISTGNFNEDTAKIYTDYTLFTSHQPILKEVEKVFRFLEASYKINKYKHLVVSPHSTSSFFTSLIEQEITLVKKGKKGLIKLKMNSLTNYNIIEKLYDASRAGVKIQLIVRGVCCLIPGIKGMSENIETISVVDKFLEHTRLMVFENDGDPLVYLSSADWMTRNLDNRVEVSCPIYDPDIKQDLLDTFTITWNDNVKARMLNSGVPNMYKKSSAQHSRTQIDLYNYYKNKLS